MFREPRIIARCRVEFGRLDRSIAAESEDLHVRGVFVRTEELLPVGAVVNLQITLPDGTRVPVVARVAHFLSPPAARALGRATGIGFSFLEHENLGRDRLVSYLEELTHGQALEPAGGVLPEGAYVLVADPSPPMRERLLNVLTHAENLHVVTVGTGSEAHAACLQVTPHLVLAACEMPQPDGFALLRALRSKPSLARVPVVLSSSDVSDLTRLTAYRLGVTDFIPRPFTDEELRIRLRRVLADKREADSVVLRGTLSNVPLSTLLSLFDFEGKSGILSLFSAGRQARLFLAGGRVVRVEGPASNVGPRRRLLQVLDWTEGDFEFSVCEVVGADDVQLQTSQLLMEHARIRDEESKQRLETEKVEERG